jgi:hypothetical protein
MSKRKVGHTTTKNTQKKSTKPTSITDQLGPENPIVGVMCVIDNKEQITPLRFAFPKVHLEPPTDISNLNLDEARETAIRDIGQLYYALTNYDKIKSTLGDLQQADVFNKLIEAAGSFIVVVAHQDKDVIATNFKPEDSVGVIVGFNYDDNEDGSFNIQLTASGINYTEYKGWLESTNNFKQQINN